MSNIQAELDEFARVYCDERYVRHQLRETFCENCGRVLEVEQVATATKRQGVDHD